MLPKSWQVLSYRQLVKYKREPIHQQQSHIHVQQQSHIHQHLYGDYLGAVEKARWGKGLGALRGTQFRRSTGALEANLWESLARNGPREPAPTPQSVERGIGYLRGI